MLSKDVCLIVLLCIWVSAGQQQRFLEVPFGSEVKNEPTAISSHQQQHPEGFQRNQGSSSPARVPLRNVLLRREEEGGNADQMQERGRGAFRGQQLPGRISQFQPVEAAQDSFRPHPPTAATNQRQFNRPIQTFIQPEEITPESNRFRQTEHRFAPVPMAGFAPAPSLTNQVTVQRLPSSQPFNTQPSRIYVRVNEPLEPLHRVTEKPTQQLQPESIKDFLDRVRSPTTQTTSPQELTPTFNRRFEQTNFRAPVLPVRQSNVIFEQQTPAVPTRRTQRPQMIPVEPPRSEILLGTRGGKPDQLDEQIVQEQEQNAMYKFLTQIDDRISDQQLLREEVRNGTSVKGMYSYSDGFVRRTVSYEADDKGYRIISEKEEPLGDGPSTDPNGQANVRSFIDGSGINYSITGADIKQRKDVPLKSKRS